MQGFSPLWRADCSLRAQEAYGGVEPAEHSADPLNANNQAELERGGKQDNNHSTPIFEVGMNIATEGYVRSTPLSRISNARCRLQRTTTCLEFAPRSQSSAKATRLQFAPSARYPDSLHSVRPQIRSTLGEVISATHENRKYCQAMPDLLKQLRCIPLILTSLISYK